jgi:hypothetical protein
MSLTNNRGLKVSDYSIATTEAAAAETVAEAGEALGLTEGYSELGDWIYNAAAEGRTGEVAVTYGTISIDVDAEPGLVYSGVEGGAVSVSVEEVDITEGTIAPEATDTVTLALLLNNTIVAYADEGFVALTGETVHEMNMHTYIGGLQPGDVLRLAVIGNTEETVDVDIAPGDVRVHG